MHFLQQWAELTWMMLNDSALFLIVGLLMAGLLSLVLDSGRVRKFLLGSKRAQVFKAALLGIPLPLCSCSVLPVAKQLRRSGVSRGGTVSFLVSTPESGIDSIMLTYTLTDPLMTVARPLTAFATAVTAGLLETAFEEESADDNSESFVASSDKIDCCDPVEGDRPIHSNWLTKIGQAVRYGITDLLDDLAPYLALGYILAGLVPVLLGGDFVSISQTWQSGWGSYLAAMIIGLPMYICATSSTPLAAALLAGGFSPGAVLVFMMVGPATNVASLVVVSRILKGWSILRYLAAIALVAVACGLLLDFIYDLTGMNAVYFESKQESGGSMVDTAAAALLLLLIVFYSARKTIRRLF